MKISEANVPEEVAGYIKAGSEDAVMLLGIDAAKAKPADIVRAVDEIVDRWQKGYRTPADVADGVINAAWIFGSLWGQQIVREFGWDWAMLKFPEERNAVAFGVLSPDRSLAIYPMTFVEVLMNYPDMDITIALSFAMLQTNANPTMPAKSYTNVMQYVHRIVPRV